MKKPISLRVALFVAVAISANLASAQTTVAPTPDAASGPKGPSRVDLGLSFAQIVNASTFSTTGTVREFAEDGTFSANYKVKGAPGGMIDLQYNLKETVGIRVGFQSSGRKSNADFTGSVPHPFFFNRPRSVQGSASGLRFTEQAITVAAVLRKTGKWGYAVDAGPAFFNLNATLADSIRYAHSFPYDTASFAGANSSRKKSSFVGISAGVSLSRALGPSFDAVAGVRYSGGTGSVTAAGKSVDVKAGGVQAQIGLRLVLMRKKAPTS